MKEEEINTFVVGNHRRVHQAPHFDPSDPEEKQILGYECLNCKTWAQTKEQLAKIGCK